MKCKNYYKILGVSEDATTEEIQQAFAQRFWNAKILSGEPELLIEARGVLTDPGSRVRHDGFLDYVRKHPDEFSELVRIHQAVPRKDAEEGEETITDEPEQSLEARNILSSPNERAMYDETRLLERKARLEAHLQSIKSKEPRLPAWVGYVTLALFVGIPVFYFWSAYRAETPSHFSPCKVTQKIVTINNGEVTSVEEYDNCEQYFLQ